MTIQFVPGDPNPSLYCLDQTIWRNHKVLVYGSGNNLIVYSLTNGRDRNLQTIYLSRDPTAVCINGTNGLICVSSGHEILIFKPVNEYMTVPKWTEVLNLSVDKSQINCLKWATIEEEIVVGTEKSIALFHVRLEYGEVKVDKRWSQTQASAVCQLDITQDSSKIVSYNSADYDYFAKIWIRTSYDDNNSSFDLTYMAHEKDEWLLSCRWRKKNLATSNSDSEEILVSMVNIRNMRNYIPQYLTESNDILYTITNNLVLNVWATYDYSGHRHLKRWAQFDLKKDLKSTFVTAMIIDNIHLQSTLIPSLDRLGLDSGFASKFKSKDMGNFDLLLVLGQSDVILYIILNIESNPPNNIILEKLGESVNNRVLPNYEQATVDAIGKKVFLDETKDHIAANPVTLGSTAVTPDANTISYLVHDRLKCTIRVVEVSFENFTGGKPDIKLANKFQGHEKSIQKLVNSSSSYEGNIMLSILDFPDHNYLWEPLLLDPKNNSDMSLNKRFCLNVTRSDEEAPHNQGIIDAILINDIAPPVNGFRHHIAIVVEKGGYLSIWDCNGSTMNDKDAELISRVEILDSNNERITRIPQSFCLVGDSITSYNVLCVYDQNLIKSWGVNIDSGASDVVYFPVTVSPLPGRYSGAVKVSAMENFLERDLTVIDEKGHFSSIAARYDLENKTIAWEQTIEIETGIEDASLIQGASLINRLAIVDKSGSVLTIWDSRSGLLEYKEEYPAEYGPVKQVDWTFIGEVGSSANAILAVGFSRFVLLYTQLRYDYTNRIPTFAVLKKIDISEYTSHEIGDAIWIDGGYLVIGGGNQFFIDDKWVELGQNSTSNSLDSTIKQLLVGFKSDQNRFLISNLAKILNGPLPVYHPQFLIQCLLMNEVKMVENILVRLLHVLRTLGSVTWNLDLDLSDMLHGGRKHSHDLSSLPDDLSLEVFQSFSSAVLDLLIEKITRVSLPLLTRHQQVTLTNVVNIVSSLSELVTSVDENGLKFLYGFKLFQSSTKQSSLTIRDISWAMHSDQKELLFSHVDAYYQHRLTWEQFKKVGLVYWIDKNRLNSLVETIARNEFGDTRDPSGRTSLLFLAIKKKQVLLGLWKVASHPEREKVLKFMSNNFTEERWRTAAQKNAFVLLGKHRYMDASYFFLLAGKVKDCCITLCNKLEEVELALAVAKVNEDREALMHIIESFVLPKAISMGDRWMTSWAFWEMRLKEISIQALIKSPHLVVLQNVEKFSEVFQRNMKYIEFSFEASSFLRDDPLLAVLFRKLRSSKINYLKGSLSVSPMEEFDFVLKVSQIYSKMGCDYLAVLLLRGWEFLDYGIKKEKHVRQDAKDLFLEFSVVPKQQISLPSSAFEEPDMSSFSFGF